VTTVIDVLVPVMRRPHRAEPFMASIRASGATGVAVTAIAQDDDEATAEAWRAAGATVLVATEPPGSFAQKCNLGFRATTAPWVLLVGDDVRFHYRWANAALRCHKRTGALVIGTNTAGPLADGGTPHPLVNRRYVLDRGAGWDGPGVLCHEGYRHNFVDIELATAAQDRGVWAVAPDAVIEHLHHIQAAKADVDEVYRIGARSLASDRALFESRRAANRVR
jgi:hypothetical protein